MPCLIWFVYFDPFHRIWADLTATFVRDAMIIWSTPHFERRFFLLSDDSNSDIYSKCLYTPILISISIILFTFGDVRIMVYGRVYGYVPEQSITIHEGMTRQLSAEDLRTEMILPPAHRILSIMYCIYVYEWLLFEGAEVYFLSLSNRKIGNM